MRRRFGLSGKYWQKREASAGIGRVIEGPWKAVGDQFVGVAGGLADAAAAFSRKGFIVLTGGDCVHASET